MTSARDPPCISKIAYVASVQVAELACRQLVEKPVWSACRCSSPDSIPAHSTLKLPDGHTSRDRRYQPILRTVQQAAAVAPRPVQRSACAPQHVTEGKGVRTSAASIIRPASAGKGARPRSAALQQQEVADCAPGNDTQTCLCAVGMGGGATCSEHAS